jgi:outer membrane immunogenic protein
MKTLILAVAFAGLSVTSVAAADLPVRTPARVPVVAPVEWAPIWSGFYIGAHGGWGGGKVKYTFLPFPGGGTGDFNAADGDIVSHQINGPLVGGHVGYNWQFGSWLLGAEIAGTWSGVDKTIIGPFFPTEQTWTTKVRWLVTPTGRVGVTAGNWLFYAKGGAAFAEIFNELNSVPIGIITTSETRVGWTVGGGVEVLVAANWVFGVEGNYYDFGTLNVLKSGSSPITHHDLDVHMWSVLGRLSYKFGAPIVARY